MIGNWKIMVAALFAAVSVGGCAWIEADRNLENAEKLRVGMTKSEVLSIMGEPVKNEIYAQPDLWFYYTHPNWIDGLVTEDECTPLVFKDGKLVGWGNEFYAKSQVIRTEEKGRDVKLLPEKK